MGDTNSSEISSNMRIAIIGTGPLSLLKAHFLSQKNPSAEITLIDSGSQTGGAWYSDYSPKGHLIECGCHIWSYAPKAYHFIENELGVNLIDMKPSPVFKGKSASLPYSLKNTIETYKAVFMHVIKLKWAALRTISQHPYIHYRVFWKKNRYPATGSPELIHAIEKKITANKQIRIILNTRVTDLKIGSCVTLFTKEKKFEFDKVFLTHVSHIQKLILPGQIIEGTPRQVDYIHFLIQSDKPLKKKMTYWRLMGDRVVHRITDISYQTGFEENLILVGIKTDVFRTRSEDQLLDHIKNLMLSYKLISDDQTLEKIKTHIFPTFYMDEELYNHLADYKDKVEALPTTDLMHGFHYLLCDETPHLINTPR